MPGSHAPRPKKNRATLHDETWLRGRYLDQNRTAYEIAVELDCSAQSVYHALDKFLIPRRSLSEARMGRGRRGASVALGSGSVSRQRQRDTANAAQLKSEMVAAYGGQCACCGEKELAFLSLDHIGGGGYDDRKQVGSGGIYRRLRGAGWPKEGYRILCMNCQFGTRGGKVCPHVSG